MNLRDELKKYSKDSTLIWLVDKIKLPKGHAWNFEDRRWQIDMIDDKSKFMVVRKPTQVGLSTIMLGKMMHFADMHRCRAIMTLPRQDDVYDMVNSRLSEIIDESPYIRDKMGDVDNVRMKRFGKSWLHFVEMSVPPRMMDVDWMLNDEVDLSNPDNLAQANSRMDASEFGYHHKISTPTIEGYGIDALFQYSDQKIWLVTCGYCSHEQELNWDMNVAHLHNSTWYVCEKCQNKLHAEDIREGHWVATKPSSIGISGYQISQLMCTYIDPNILWEHSQKMPRKDFYNFKLGLPYSSASGGFDKAFITERCVTREYDKQTAAHSSSTYVIGCDQGDVLHVCVIRIREGKRDIVYLAEIPFDRGFDELGRLIQVFNAKSIVLDGLPNHHSAKQLINSLKNKKAYTAYFNYGDKTYIADDDERRIAINKTDAYDFVLQTIINGSLSFYGITESVDPVVNKAITHLSNMRRDIERQVTRASGAHVFHVWKNIGPDHYADAIVYAVLAADIIASSNKAFSVVNLDELMTTGLDAFMSGMSKEDMDWARLILDPPEKSKRGALESTLNKQVDSENVPLDKLGLMPLNPYQAKRAIFRLFDGKE